MKQIFTKALFIPAVLLVGGSLFFAGIQVGESGILDNLTYDPIPDTPPATVQNAALPETVAQIDFNNFWRVWNLVHTEYIDREELDDQQLLYGAIEGMVSAVGDPYTAFLDPEKNEQFAESLSGTYEGIGAELGMVAEQLIIVAPLVGSPAEAVGILPQDRILKINDEDTRGITIPEAVSKIRGPAGEKVTLSLGRGDGDPFSVEIVRAEITLKSVAYDAAVNEKYLQPDEGIAYVQLSRFGDNTLSDWEQSLQQVLKDVNPLKAFILDLRSNPGGYLTTSVQLAGDFLPPNTPVVYQETKAGIEGPLRANGKGRLNQVPLVVLVNQGSASASEILASALRNSRQDVTIVGMKTYGKGTVQEKKDLPDGSGIQVTIAKWLTSSKEWIQEDGIPVDIEVDITSEDIVAGKDPQLEKALEIARSY